MEACCFVVEFGTGSKRRPPINKPENVEKLISSSDFKNFCLYVFFRSSGTFIATNICLAMKNEKIMILDQRPRKPPRDDFRGVVLMGCNHPHSSFDRGFVISDPENPETVSEAKF
ncbi:hypothetical protein NQ318_017166 [Aromia moschata]|uniref:Uncharacterized protein n=1 Tax=Aromia moschata TaxID=1265417 RepID=A0AAV8YML8_9CUCU|nr:hypothetical protein NQ318_017166 [Aromia moschata]